jgi:hypothetical protein
MLCIAVKMYIATKEDPGAWIDMLCYLALAGIGIAGCVTMAQIVSRIPEKASFDLHNDSDYTRYVYGKSGLIATIAPGESVHLDIPYNELIQYRYDSVLRIEMPDAPWYVPSSVMRAPDAINYIENLKQAPIAPNAIPYTLPASSIITKELN